MTDRWRGFRDFLLSVAFILLCGFLCGVALAVVAAVFAR